MPLKRSTGNMYPWVTHTHSHLGGECPHRCSYCYVQAMERRFKGGRYTGPLRLIEEEFAVNYGTGKIIFIEHLNDLFADEVPGEWIGRVLMHCCIWSGNTYVFQTKNPKRYADFRRHMPSRRILGTTIETNRSTAVVGHAPSPAERAYSMMLLYGENRFVTIEPVLDFDVEPFVAMLRDIRPDFVNIGADSKGHGLAEPGADKIRALLGVLNALGIEVREKRNLERLLASGGAK